MQHSDAREKYMPIIRVEMFKGRTRDQKRELVKEVTDAFVRTCGGKPEGLSVVITEVEKEDWGMGGQLMADKYPD
ncbi:2-hydroxymuconate tautomerase [Rhodovibrionaceae bacterium A322]